MSHASATASGYAHVVLDPDGVPTIAGSTMKVVEIVMAQQAHGWSPEEIHFQHPYLPLGHIYSALAYYWDHQQELDADIDRQTRFSEDVRKAAGPSPLAEKLGEPELIARAAFPQDLQDRVEFLPL